MHISIKLPNIFPSCNLGYIANTAVTLAVTVTATDLAIKTLKETFPSYFTASKPFLNWRERPLQLRQAISESFEKIVVQQSTYKGASLYFDSELADIDINEHELMKKIIQNAPANQKEFYVLDIGAGRFEWSHALANYLNEESDLPKDVLIHIIGIRGEPYKSSPFLEKGPCKLYRFGSFKIEEIESEFEKLNLDLTAKIDLAVSRFTFSYFFDPVGTFAQVYHLLRPSTGYLLMDGLTYATGDKNKETMDVLLDTKAPFLIITYPYLLPYDTLAYPFLLQRQNASLCQLPMRYTNTVGKMDEERGSIIGNVYEKTRPHRKLNNCSEEYLACGDRKLYEFINKTFWNERSVTWQPIQEGSFEKK